MQPGVWYCASDYEGCALLESGTPVRGKLFRQLIAEGLVESLPVFEGFTIRKYRITPSGSAWLAAL